MKDFKVATNYRWLAAFALLIASLLFKPFIGWLLIVLSEALVLFGTEEDKRNEHWPFLTLALLPGLVLSAHSYSVEISQYILTSVLLLYVFLKFLRWPVSLYQRDSETVFEKFFVISSMTMLFLFLEILTQEVRIPVIIAFLVSLAIRNFLSSLVFSWLGLAIIDQAFVPAGVVIALILFLPKRPRLLLLLNFVCCLFIDWRVLDMFSQIALVGLGAYSLTVPFAIDDGPIKGLKNTYRTVALLLVAYFSGFIFIYTGRPLEIPVDYWFVGSSAILIGSLVGLSLRFLTRYEFRPLTARMCLNQKFSGFFSWVNTSGPTIDSSSPDLSTTKNRARESSQPEPSYFGEVGQLALWLCGLLLFLAFGQLAVRL